ncbi:hypothetical protein AN1V17_49930 [Vallitalea sediminicola]
MGKSMLNEMSNKHNYAIYLSVANHTTISIARIILSSIFENVSKLLKYKHRFLGALITSAFIPRFYLQRASNGMIQQQLP